ncbi:MAG: hypothetical protein WD068_02125 [Candidatus Babeliales bacterium]
MKKIIVFIGILAITAALQGMESRPKKPRRKPIERVRKQINILGNKDGVIGIVSRTASHIVFPHDNATNALQRAESTPNLDKQLAILSEATASTQIDSEGRAKAVCEAIEKTNQLRTKKYSNFVFAQNLLQKPDDQRCYNPKTKQPYTDNELKGMLLENSTYLELMIDPWNAFLSFLKDHKENEIILNLLTKRLTLYTHTLENLQKNQSHSQNVSDIQRTSCERQHAHLDDIITKLIKHTLNFNPSNEKRTQITVQKQGLHCTYSFPKKMDSLLATLTDKMHQDEMLQKCEPLLTKIDTNQKMREETYKLYEECKTLREKLYEECKTLRRKEEKVAYKETYELLKVTATKEKSLHETLKTLDANDALYKSAYYECKNYYLEAFNTTFLLHDMIPGLENDERKYAQEYQKLITQRRDASDAEKIKLNTLIGEKAALVKAQEENITFHKECIAIVCNQAIQDQINRELLENIQSLWRLEHQESELRLKKASLEKEFTTEETTTNRKNALDKITLKITTITKQITSLIPQIAQQKELVSELLQSLPTHTTSTTST